MRNKYLVFFLFIFALFYIFSKIEITSVLPVKGNVPDFVLENSYIEHFTEGTYQFSVKAEKIEIFKKKFVFNNAQVSFNYGIEISAKNIEADLKKSRFIAKQNVELKNDKIEYNGDEVVYFIKEKRFIGYNGGNIRMIKD